MLYMFLFKTNKYLCIKNNNFSGRLRDWKLRDDFKSFTLFIQWFISASLELRPSSLCGTIEATAVLACSAVAALVVGSFGVGLLVSTAAELRLLAVATLAVGALRDSDAVGTATKLVCVTHATFELGPGSVCVSGIINDLVNMFK